MKKPSNHSNPFVVLTAVSAALTCILVSGCSPEKSAAASGPAAASKSIPVVAIHPKLITVTNLDEYPGHIEAVESVEVRPRVSGYIDSVHFTDGAEVKKGDLLFVIDSKPYQADYDRAVAERQSAETRLELAQNDLKRAESLKAAKAVSDEELDTRSKAVRSAQSALAAAKAAEAFAEVNLGYTKITAPIDGRIGSRQLTPGNLVQPGGSPLATIVTLSPIYCYFDADETAFLGYRKSGSNTTSALQMPCALSLGGDPSVKASGTVDFFDNQVNPKTGTIRMRAVFANENRSLIPGLFANVRIPVGGPVNVLTIPDTLISSSQGRKMVMTVSPSNTLSILPIVTGRLHGADRAVQGLSAEDNVIDSGQLQIIGRPGMPVMILTNAPKPAPSTAGAQH
jgi:multidrug efflux system membrane fusion protein